MAAELEEDAPAMHQTQAGLAQNSRWALQQVIFMLSRELFLYGKS